jgi:glycosyltransferase involved in cell wall biosynthesis
MRSMPRVSIIVPVYGREFLDEALASIEAQTYRDIEVVVEEDPDATGAAAARNRGIARASGEFVAFCDADDYLAPDAIEKMVAAIGDCEMVCGSFRKFGTFEMLVQCEHAHKKRRRDVAVYAMANLHHPRTHQHLSGCWAKLYRREHIGRFPALITAEDMAFNFDYLLRACSAVRFLPDIVYHNRKHAGSLTTTYDPSKPRGLLDVIQALSYVRRFLLERYTEDEVERAIDNSKVYHSMLYFMRICEHQGGTMRDNFTRLYP